jgi:hypothetical protein
LTAFFIYVSLEPMSRSKEQFIEATGGFRFGESEEDALKRFQAIHLLEKKLSSGLTLGQRDEVVEEMRRLKGLPPVEWDYEEE